MPTDEVPTAWAVQPPPRETLSVRVQPVFRSELEAFVAELQSQGWRGLQKHHVIEHLLRGLMTEEGKAQLVAELREARPE
ncbi:hypothetical protein EHF33_20430 (plasmid) [Deinococcus psychrotolerans]|uniref:Uncharacterized protein n=1 Tax=Deinococcus psychrotolerans TaxID=2489213 RepID=A0A3G8YJ45_9DEIO|nr:hypothetical protein [Deinococcus psychrotolerans]AZI45279.1 hypothetical protein EHF33_20430 [Deinococcus psychrotolerans]